MTAVMAAPLALRARAALELRRRRTAPLSFADHLALTAPHLCWDWPYMRAMIAGLDAITEGTVDRDATFLPPRHGKTELRTIRYAAWRLERDPALRLIVAGYNQSFAERFSRRIRRLVRERRVAISADKDTAADWETEAGGGVRAVGVGSGVTGHGADLLIVDDPVKSREEAESPTYRDRSWGWWADDLMTRLEPGGAVLLTMTRWHWDDLAGRVLGGPDAAHWPTLTLPALAEEGDPLGRTIGEALCPDRYPVDALHRIREGMTEYSWSALYQQRPTPRTGNLFPRDKVWPPVEPHEVPEGTRWCRGWDKAGTQDGGKRTAGVLIGRAPNGRWFVGHVVKGQWALAERENRIKQTAMEDGPATLIELEAEGGSGGKDSAALTVQMLAGYSVRATHPTGDKVTRADGFAAQWQHGNVALVRGDWNRDYLDELELFPSGKYLDQADASALAFNRLALDGGPWQTTRVIWG